MSAQSKMSRKAFLAGLAALVAAGCGSDSEDEKGSGTGGQAGSGTGGSGTGGSGTGGSGTGGSGTGGSSGGAGGTAGSTGGSAGTSTGGSAGSGGGNPGACAGDITALIYANHDHELIIPLADITAGVEKEYMTTGAATHCHRVTVTAADFATLASGGVVLLKSCINTNHQYVLSCGTPPAPEAPDGCASTPNLGACN